MSRGVGGRVSRGAGGKEGPIVRPVLLLSAVGDVLPGGERVGDSEGPCVRQRLVPSESGEVLEDFGRGSEGELVSLSSRLRLVTR